MQYFIIKLFVIVCSLTVTAGKGRRYILFMLFYKKTILFFKLKKRFNFNTNSNLNFLEVLYKTLYQLRGNTKMTTREVNVNNLIFVCDTGKTETTSLWEGGKTTRINGLLCLAAVVLSSPQTFLLPWQQSHCCRKIIPCVFPFSLCLS